MNSPHPASVTSRSFLGDDESFSSILQRFMRERRFSVSRLAEGSWLDTAYVWRLSKEHSDPLNMRPDLPRGKHPSRDTAVRLGLALNLRIEHMDELLLAAGYAPLVR